MSRQVEVKDKELADLTKRFTELDAALQDALKQRDEMSSIAASRIPISFLVMMQSDKVTSIFGLFEGENVFGNQLICSARVADPHFSVRALTHQDSKGRARTKFYVSPLKGRIYRSAQNANEIIGETEMEKTDSIYIDNVRFTLVANINK